MKQGYGSRKVDGNEKTKRRVLIVAPSLDLSTNVSGVSAVTNFIIEHNEECEYIHFMQGKSDGESGALNRLKRIWKNYRKWKTVINGDEMVHYNFPLDAFSILRDYFFMRVARNRGKKMVIHVHGGLYLFKEQQPFLIRCILREVFSWDCPFIVLSNKEKEQIQKRYHTKQVALLPNSVDLTEAEKHRKCFGPGRLEILYLGRIEPNKGMDYLLEAMKELQSEKHDFVLHFAGIEQGANGYIDQFRQLMGSRFVYEGVVARSQKTDLFIRCHVFVMPSLYEGLPMSLLECMSFGLVPVVTDVGSISEYVEDGVNGVLMKVRDVGSIVTAIDGLLQDRRTLQRMSVLAQQTILSRLQPEQYIHQLNEIYSNT